MVQARLTWIFLCTRPFSPHCASLPAIFNCAAVAVYCNQSLESRWVRVRPREAPPPKQKTTLGTARCQENASLRGQARPFSLEHAGAKVDDGANPLLPPGPLHLLQDKVKSANLGLNTSMPSSAPHPCSGFSSGACVLFEKLSPPQV